MASPNITSTTLTIGYSGPYNSGDPGNVTEIDAGGILLGRSQYAPSSADAATLVISSTGLTALNFTTSGHVASVTFTAPGNGNALVKLKGFVKGGAAAGTSVVFGVTSSTASPGTMVGVTGLVMLTPTAMVADNGVVVEYAQIVTGLTSGTSYTWYFAAMYSGTAPSIVAQGATGQTTVPTGAPCLFEVYSA